MADALFLPRATVSGQQPGVTGIGAFTELTHYGLDVAEMNLTAKRRQYFLAQMGATAVDSALYTATNTGTASQVFLQSPVIAGWQTAGSYRLSTTTGATNQAGVTYGVQTLLGADFTQFHGRLDFFIPQLSNATDSFFLRAGVVNFGARDHLCILYSHDVNGGNFQLRTAAGATTVDTGVPVVANKVYSFDYYVNVTTPGNTAANPFTVRITNVTDGTAPVVLTGNMVAGNTLGSSLESPCGQVSIQKRAGTTACLAYNTHFLFEGIPR